MSSPLPPFPPARHPAEAEMEADALRQRGMKQFWASLRSYAAVLSLLWLGVYLGALNAGAVLLLTGVVGVSQWGIYLALQLGSAVRSQDPMLAFTQVSIGIALVGLGYAFLDGLRSTALLWLCVIVVFDVSRLPRRHVAAAMAQCVVLPVLATLLRHCWHTEPVDWGHELYTLLTLAVVLPALYAVSSHARATKARHLKQKLQMSETLDALHRLSIRDGLTGAYNRRHMLSLLEDEARRHQRTGRPFTVAMIDLDLFKQVNDRHGHAVGDAVLQAFAQLASACFPDSADMFGRWGGEEFLLLQTETTLASAQAAMGALQKACAAHDWGQYANGLRVTFSAGLCQHERRHTVQHTLELADKALYRAKAAGRNTVVSHEAPEALGQTLVRSRHVGLHAGALPAHAAGAGKGPGVGEAASAGPTTAAPQSDQAGQKQHASSVVRRWVARLGDAVLGTDPKRRPAMHMCILSMVVYMTSMAGFLFYIIPVGLLSFKVGMGFVVHNALALLVPYPLLRSGATARWRDPLFVLPQVLWGGTGVIIGYGLMPSTSPSTLQMVCLSLVFGFSSLRTRQVVWLGRYYIALMLGVLAVRAYLPAPGFEPAREALEVCMTCVVLAVLTLLSKRLALTREKVSEEKRALVRATEQVSQIMVRDPLTGLFNRQHMQMLLDREAARHERSSASFCVALIDLDHFKAINDNHGHAMGDEVLKAFAQAASQHLRDCDVLCRWGGEEFLVLLVGADPGLKGQMAMARLREAMAALPICPSVPELRVTFSAGVAEHAVGEPIARMLQRADEALYAAKASGRDTCRLAPMPSISVATRAVG